MSSINELSEASAVSSSMQIPVYDSSNGQPRKVSVLQLQEYMAANPATSGSPIPLPQLSVAELAEFPAANYVGCLAYCTNGNSGNPCLALSIGTAWLGISLGGPVNS